MRQEHAPRCAFCDEELDNPREAVLAWWAECSDNNCRIVMSGAVHNGGSRRVCMRWADLQPDCLLTMRADHITPDELFVRVEAYESWDGDALRWFLLTGAAFIRMNERLGIDPRRQEQPEGTEL